MKNLKTLIEFTDKVLLFQDVDDVLSGRDEEWLDMDREEWLAVIAANKAVKDHLGVK